MKKSLIDALKGYFSKDFRKKLKADSIIEMAERLEQKRKKLKKKMAQAKGDTEKKLLKKQIKVLGAQIAKAEKLNKSE